MLASMEDMVASWWREEIATPGDAAAAVFTTGANQTRAQARSRYFFESADRVHFFREAIGSGTSTAGDENKKVRPPLNKVGHGLHYDRATPFGAYAHSAKVAAVAREVAGLHAPVLVSAPPVCPGRA